MRLYTTIGLLGIVVSLIGTIFGFAMAELVGLKNLDSLWLVIPLAVIGWVIGAWIETKSYKDTKK
jgi:hypothetical protein